MYLITVYNMNIHAGRTGFDYEVSRVPCVGEELALPDEGGVIHVEDVRHFLNADSDNEVVAEVRCR